MQKALKDRRGRSLRILGLSGASLLVLSGFVGSAAASDQTTRVSRSTNCALLGEGFIAMQGVEGCLRVGGHVRVEAQVMRGAATLGGGLPYAGDGPSQAGMRSDAAPTTRMRMRELPDGYIR